MRFYTFNTEEILEKFSTSEAGLSSQEAKDRLKRYGRNAVKIKGEPLWRKIVEPFWNFFMLVLIVAGALSLWHGDSVETIIIFAIIAITASIYYVQIISTERILRALQKRNEQDVTTYRNSKPTKIDAEELVPGDIIELAEGEKVPADCRVIHASALRTDESLLTGESTPVTKNSHALSEPKEVYEQTNMLFQGSYIVAGETMAVVVATGNETEFGQLAALSSRGDTESPVQKKIDKLISQIIFVVCAMAIVSFALSLFRGMEISEAFSLVLTLAVSAVPEGLPVATTIILALGMRRMAKRKALVRNMRAIESVGVITTIATDKTGTLTKNRLTVQDAWAPQSDDQQFIPRRMLLATNRKGSTMHDPLDSAFHSYTNDKKAKLNSHTAHHAALPFNQAYAMSGNVWRIRGKYELYVKGAPEYILDASSITKAERSRAEEELKVLTEKGYRVIALAHTELAEPINAFEKLDRKKKLQFGGFVAVADILRPESKRSVAAAIDAGVTVRMVTGDHVETAYSIGKELGMVERRNQVFDSRKMHEMNDKQLEETVRNARVFARVVPEQKYRILSILKKDNVTAMTGDGVNDVPALSNAHVGVAMGAGSQIAKEAGDIVLLNNNFKSIIEAMREGRIIYSNIRRMLYYLLSTNAGEFLTILGALALGIPVPLATVQILWINLVTDTAVVIPLGLEPGEKHVMKEKPRRPDAPILDKFIITRMILIALAIAIVSLTIFQTFSASHSAGYASTLVFATLVAMQWANAFNARSEKESILTRIKTFNGKFYIGLGIAFTLQLLALYGPFQSFLGITPVAVSDLLLTCGIGMVIVFVIGEFHKVIGRRF